MTTRLYYEDDACRLFLGDCREVMPALEPGTAALVLTDMPYGIGGGAAFVRGGEGGIENCDAAKWNMLVPMGQWLPAVERLLMPGGHFVTFHNFRDVERTLAAIRAAGLDPWTRFWWVKPNPPCTPRPSFRSGIEEAVVATKLPRPRRWFGGGTKLNYWYGPTGTRADMHPCHKPEPMLRLLIRALTAPGDLVIDPFAGGGSTLRAAKDEGRRAVGIEIDPGYCAMAKRLIAQETLFRGAAEMGAHFDTHPVTEENSDPVEP